MLLQSHSVNTSIEPCTTHLLRQEESQSQLENTHSVNELSESQVFTSNNLQKFAILYFEHMIPCLITASLELLVFFIHPSNAFNISFAVSVALVKFSFPTFLWLIWHFVFKGVCNNLN